jgi:hypothetical protein
MTSDFAPEVAEEILIASRGLMRRLATDAPILPDPDGQDGVTSGAGHHFEDAGETRRSPEAPVSGWPD